MFAEIGRLLWIIIVGIGGFKILMGLPWALCGRMQFRATIHTPKKKVNIYFILCILFIQCAYLHFFSPQEMISALQFSFGLGVPVGILGLALYSWALKQKKKGTSLSPWIKDESEPMLNKIEYSDYLNNCLGFSAIFLATFIFFTDFFDVLVRIFIK